MDLRNQPEGKDRESGRRRWKVAIMCDYIKITNFMCKIAQTHEQFYKNHEYNSLNLCDIVNTIKKQKMILRIRKEVRGTVEQEILYGS